MARAQENTAEISEVTEGGDYLDIELDEAELDAIIAEDEELLQMLEEQAEAEERLVQQQQHEVGSTASSQQQGALPGDAEDMYDRLGISPLEYKRKAAMLLEIITAGDDAFDSKVAQFRSELDDAMIVMMQQRVSAEEQVASGQSTAQLEHLRGILRVLQVELQRKQASRAQRLLDDVLDVMGDVMDSAAGSAEAEQRRQEAGALLRQAFVGGPAPGVDIFAAAEALAAGQSLSPEDLATEHVPAFEFLAEATELLSDVKKQQKELQAGLEAFSAEVRQVQEQRPELLRTPEARQHMRQLQEAKRIYSERQLVIGQLEDVIYMARSIQVEMGQQGQRVA